MSPPVFQSQYQNGPFVEVFSSSGSSSTVMNWKVKSAKKLYEKNVKGYLYQIEKNGRLSMPKDDLKQSAYLIQPYLVIQCFLVAGEHANFELGLTDVNKNKRRYVISSFNREFKSNTLHVSLPMQDLKRGVWMNLVFDLTQLITSSFRAQTFRALDSIAISGSVKVRRIFTMKMKPKDTTGEYDFATNGTESIHKSVQFPIGVDHITQIFKPATNLIEATKKVERVKNPIAFGRRADISLPPILSTVKTRPLSKLELEQPANPVCKVKKVEKLPPICKKPLEKAEQISEQKSEPINPIKTAVEPFLEDIEDDFARNSSEYQTESDEESLGKQPAYQNTSTSPLSPDTGPTPEYEEAVPYNPDDYVDKLSDGANLEVNESKPSEPSLVLNYDTYDSIQAEIEKHFSADHIAKVVASAKEAETHDELLNSGAHMKRSSIRQELEQLVDRVESAQLINDDLNVIYGLKHRKSPSIIDFDEADLYSYTPEIAASSLEYAETENPSYTHEVDSSKLNSMHLSHSRRAPHHSNIGEAPFRSTSTETQLNELNRSPSTFELTAEQQSYTPESMRSRSCSSKREHAGSRQRSSSRQSNIPRVPSNLKISHLPELEGQLSEEIIDPTPKQSIDRADTAVDMYEDFKVDEILKQSLRELRGMSESLREISEENERESDGGDETVDLVYDQERNLYFDPRTGKYYEVDD